MRNYLSFGGGVNSVAMYLMLRDQGVDFEAVFVDHETDWPETYEYVDMFRKKYPLTVIKPERKTNGKEITSLYEFSWEYKLFPSRARRWCTIEFKQVPLNKYQESPAFVFIGFDYGEAHRAKIYTDKGREFRYPLIENELERYHCEEIIKDAGLPIPIKSGCYICPFQRVGQLRQLRREHPDLFCKLEQLENRNNEERLNKGLEPYYSFRKPVAEVVKKAVDENQLRLFKESEYPPCECML